MNRCVDGARAFDETASPHTDARARRRAHGALERAVARRRGDARARARGGRGAREDAARTRASPEMATRRVDAHGGRVLGLG
jgi:hypothetical protein